MTSKEAIEKIKSVLNLSFKTEKFATTSLEDGTEVTNNLDSDFQIGQVLYVVGESTLTPAPDVEEVKSLAEEMKKLKTKMEQEMSSLKTDFDSFKKSPEKFSVVEKKTFKESLDDYKLDVIKAMRR